MADLEWTGIPELTQRLQGLALPFEVALILALRTEAKAILDASRPLVPYDTGDLAGSGVVEEEADATVIRYGGHGAFPYAIVQHFNTEFQHPGGKQAFYLQEPFFAATAGMAERLAASVAARLGSL